MTNKPFKKPLPRHLWKRGKKGHVICQCGRGYGSEYDGLCYNCRGTTAYAAKLIGDLK